MIYTPSGVCAKEIHFELDENGKIHDASFIGGCNGNLKGICSLIEGMDAKEVISRLEGAPDRNLAAYASCGSPQYEAMVADIAAQFGLTSLKFSKLDTIVKAIGLPKECICTHCFDGSSFYTLEEQNTQE